MNIKLPETDVVSCVFSLKNSTNTCNQEFDSKLGVLPYDKLHKLKKYYYRVPAYLKGQLHPGDFVLVHCNTGYQACQVYQINEFAPVETPKLAAVVAKLDLEPYFNELAHQEMLDQMKAQLIAERKRLEERVTWDLIANSNPEFAKMLQSFREAGGDL